jgi:hypothetical protein
MGETAILLGVLQVLPEIMVTAPKVGESIYNLFHQHKDALPAEVQAALADVKRREAPEDAEWDADLPATPGGLVGTPAAPVPSGRDAEIERLNAVISRQNEQIAALQANGGTAGDEAPPPGA